MNSATRSATNAGDRPASDADATHPVPAAHPATPPGPGIRTADPGVAAHSSAAPGTATDEAPTPARAARSDAVANRDAILAAALRALSRDPEVGLETIAAEAGLTRRAVYGHFASRDELVGEALESAARDIASSVASIAVHDPALEIAAIGTVLWRRLEPVRLQAHFAVRGPYRERVAAALAPLRSRLLAAVRRGHASGALRSDLAPPATARLIEGAILAVLDDAAQGLPGDTAHDHVVLAALGAAGLSWREADATLDRALQLTRRTCERDAVSA